MTAPDAQALMQRQLDAELGRGLPEAVREMAAALAARAGGGCRAVLFYGSGLRTADLDAVLDFYLVLDRVGDWPAGPLTRLGNRLLPPNVGYAEVAAGDGLLRAKYAVISARQLLRGVAFGRLDTTLWARFSQPVALAWQRDAVAGAELRDTLVEAVTTAARWAALLGPHSGRAEDYWQALYAHTYGAELRVESAARPQSLLSERRERWQPLLQAAWHRAGVHWRADGEQLQPRLDETARRRGRRQWERRRRLGKPLNIARLVKAAFTFENGPDYLAYKVERHSGVPLALTPWQRRHPILAAPLLLWRLRRQGVLR